MKKILENVGIKDAQDQLGINGGLRYVIRKWHKKWADISDRAWALVVNVVFAFFVDFLGRRAISKHTPTHGPPEAFEGRAIAPSSLTAYTSSPCIGRKPPCPEPLHTIKSGT